jgi:hypothetical protein
MPIHDGAGLDTLEQYIYASRRQFIARRVSEISRTQKDMTRDSIDLPLLASSGQGSQETLCMEVPVERRQKTAPLGAVFGVLSSAGLVALNSFYGLATKPFTVSSLYALAVF